MSSRQCLNGDRPPDLRVGIPTCVPNHHVPGGGIRIPNVSDDIKCQGHIANPRRLAFEGDVCNFGSIGIVVNLVTW